MLTAKQALTNIARIMQRRMPRPLPLPTRFWLIYRAWRDVVGPVRAFRFALGTLFA